ncbi:phosphatase PAP2 family protein [Sulfurimonas sp.]|uniref:phosphatase PAP2 family protein n=1 Tax=Sulfurimonas sp. TaxID=2022749 RepID=UPI0025DE3B11|nr:phosphatase PAP2 family protein [Sulfurimonas sp.]MBW6489018.1 phosphatase PAP2 family protein [Sulfurimonas sp.]
MQQSRSRELLITLFLLLGVILLFASTNLDIFIQEFFYNANNNQWFLDRNEPLPKFIFYDGIKKLIILFAIGILFVLIFFRKNKTVLEYKKGLIIVLLSIIIVPLSIGSLKAVTNMPCPKNIQHFNGKYPDVNLFQCYPDEFKAKNPDCSIKCWPAGHASGGFALLSLFFLFKSRRNRKRAVIIALSVGFSMGTYKMLIGDHFFSHTIITMLIAWLIILLIDSLKTIQQRRYIAQPAEI